MQKNGLPSVGNIQVANTNKDRLVMDTCIKLQSCFILNIGCSRKLNINSLEILYSSNDIALHVTPKYCHITLTRIFPSQS